MSSRLPKTTCKTTIDKGLSAPETLIEFLLRETAESAALSVIKDEDKKETSNLNPNAPPFEPRNESNKSVKHSPKPETVPPISRKAVPYNPNQPPVQAKFPERVRVQVEVSQPYEASAGTPPGGFGNKQDKKQPGGRSNKTNKRRVSSNPYGGLLITFNTNP